MRRITFNPKDLIVDEDEALLVVCKPAGIAVQSKGTGAMDLEHLLLNYLAQSRHPNGRGGGKEGGLPYLGVVHRLDQPVEGLLVFAKTRQASAALSAQLSSHRMSKEYLAVVDGIPPMAEGCLTDYLLRDGRQNRSRVVKADTKGAKKAILYYSCLQTDPARCQSLLQIHLVTGRHHQIRVQLAHAGLPLAGDGKYHPNANREASTLPSENREAASAYQQTDKDSSPGSLALCAYHLTFPHPITGQKLEYQVAPKGRFFAYFRMGDHPL